MPARTARCITWPPALSPRPGNVPKLRDPAARHASRPVLSWVVGNSESLAASVCEPQPVLMLRFDWLVPAAVLRDAVVHLQQAPVLELTCFRIRAMPWRVSLPSVRASPCLQRLKESSSNPCGAGVFVRLLEVIDRSEQVEVSDGEIHAATLVVGADTAGAGPPRGREQAPRLICSPTRALVERTGSQPDLRCASESWRSYGPDHGPGESG